MSYGQCWTCGADVVSRTRGIPPMDTCTKGHTHDASLTLRGAMVEEIGKLRETATRFAAFAATSSHKESCPIHPRDPDAVCDCGVEQARRYLKSISDMTERGLEVRE